MREPFATLLGGVALLVTAASLYNWTIRFPFPASRADIAAFAHSRVPKWMLAAWLQVRRLVSTGVRMGFGAGALLPFFTNGEIARAMLGIVGVPILISMAALPLFFATRRFGKWILRAVCGVLAIFGLSVIIAVMISMASHSLWAEWTISHGVGPIVLAIWSADPRVLGSVYAGAAAMFCVGIIAARDILPDLYAALTPQIYSATTRNQTKGRFGSNIPQPRVRVAVLSAEVWKETSVIRNRVGWIGIIAAPAAAIVAGVVAGLLIKADPKAAAIITGSLVLLLVAFPILNSVNLANDISKPLWWMGNGSVIAKLAAWVAAKSLPQTTLLFAFVVCASAVTRNGSFATILILASLLVPVSLRSMGLLSYALSPSRVDQLGPSSALRALFVCVASTIAIASGVLCENLIRVPGSANFVAMSVLAVEGIIAIACAASVISTRGVEYAFAERI